MKTTLLLLAILAVQEEGGVQVRKDFIPNHERPLPVKAGRHVMALVPRTPSLHDPKEFRPDDHTLMLSASAGGYRWCYVTLPTGRPAMANVENTLDLGVTRTHSLVEVDVTEEPGSPNGAPRLVARSLKVVDNTKDFPIQTHKVVAELRTKYEAWLKEREKEIAPAMEKARNEAKGDEKRAKPARSATVMHVTWMEETGKLQVRFLTRVLTTDEIPRQGPHPRNSIPPPPQKWWWGIDFGGLYEVSKSGVLEKRLTLPIETWNSGFPPPPVLDWADYK